MKMIYGTDLIFENGFLKTANYNTGVTVIKRYRDDVKGIFKTDIFNRFLDKDFVVLADNADFIEIKCNDNKIKLNKVKGGVMPIDDVIVTNFTKIDDWKTFIGNACSVLFKSDNFNSSYIVAGKTMFYWSPVKVTFCKNTFDCDITLSNVQVEALSGFNFTEFAKGEDFYVFRNDEETVIVNTIPYNYEILEKLNNLGFLKYDFGDSLIASVDVENLALDDFVFFGEQKYKNVVFKFYDDKLTVESNNVYGEVVRTIECKSTLETKCRINAINVLDFNKFKKVCFVDLRNSGTITNVVFVGDYNCIIATLD